MFQSPGTTILGVTSQAIPKGMTDERWFRAYLEAAPQNQECFPPRASWKSITIAGHPAGLHGGFPGCGFTEAIAIVDRRAYIFTGIPNNDVLTGEIFDRALLDAFLATVKFHPRAAE